jgi:arsenate reductase-like glutaredoxin family protein
MSVNRNHKSSVFSKLFSNQDVLRELYSAIEKVDIPPDVSISINTLSEALYLTQINDVSFTIDDRLVILIEHQSTINENLPLRLLLYIGRIYEKILDFRKKYQKKLEKIPRPEFIVLYNGKDPYPDYNELSLSDAFKDVKGLKMYENGLPLSLELVVQVYNINHGRNPQILEKSSTLNGYSFFMEKIREFNRNLPLDESVKAAVKYCVDAGVLKQFLTQHGSEVINMLFEELTVEEIIDIRVEEAVEEALEEAREEAKKEALEEAKKEACEYVLNLLEQGLPVEEIKQWLKQKKTG